MRPRRVLQQTGDPQGVRAPKVGRILKLSPSFCEDLKPEVCACRNYYTNHIDLTIQFVPSKKKKTLINSERHFAERQNPYSDFSLISIHPINVRKLPVCVVFSLSMCSVTQFLSLVDCSFDSGVSCF